MAYDKDVIKFITNSGIPYRIGRIIEILCGELTNKGLMEAEEILTDELRTRGLKQINETESVGRWRCLGGHPAKDGLYVVELNRKEKIIAKCVNGRVLASDGYITKQVIHPDNITGWMLLPSGTSISTKQEETCKEKDATRQKRGRARAVLCMDKDKDEIIVERYESAADAGISLNLTQDRRLASKLVSQIIKYGRVVNGKRLKYEKSSRSN